MPNVQCGHCQEIYILLPESVKIEIYVRSPFSKLHAACDSCGEENIFRIPTVIAAWLSWAGVSSRHGIDDLEVMEYFATLEDADAFAAEIEELRKNSS